MRLPLAAGLFLVGCTGLEEPWLLVTTDAAEIDDSIGERAKGASGEDADPTEGIEAGTAVHVAWILPAGVPDPDDPASFRIETACTSTTVEIPFADGVARTVFDAPPGAEAGLVVAVSALNAADTSAFPAFVPEPGTTDTDPGVDCGDAEAADEADDTDGS